MTLLEETEAVQLSDNEGQILFHLHLSDSTPVEEEQITLDDGETVSVIWKDVLVEGSYPMSPGPGGRAVPEPMHVVAEGKSDVSTKTISMSDVIESHKDGAFKYVTIPTSHRDQSVDNTGYVVRPNGLRVIDKNGKKVMQAALGFTEPDIKGKVSRGTIPDVSGGFFFNWLNKHKKKTYPVAMKHVALTPIPFMGNLDPFPAIFASDEEIADDTKVEVYNFAGEEGSSESNDDPDKGEIVWNEQESYNWLRSEIEAAFRPEPVEEGRPELPKPSYYVQDVSTVGTALVEEWFKGDRRRWVVPFNVEGGKAVLSPATRWVEVKEAMIAASDTAFDDISSEKICALADDSLQKMVGDDHLRATEISLDNRIRIENTKEKTAWIASFILSDDQIWIEPSNGWQAIELNDAPEQIKAPIKQPQLKVDPTSRVQAARQRRRQMLGK
jgi:hypothetical protein